MKKKVKYEKLVLQFVGLASASCEDLNRWIVFCKNPSTYVPAGIKAVQIHNTDYNLQRTIDNVLKGRGLVPFSQDGSKILWKAREVKT